MTECTRLLAVTNIEEVTKALKLIARYYHQDRGVFVNEAFDHINSFFFGGNLPRPLIQIALTPFGHCLGLTYTRSQDELTLPPVITLHPSVFEPGQTNKPDKGGPWQVHPGLLGMSFAYEVLLHEFTHIQCNYLLSTRESRLGWFTSHNNPVWVGEVQRMGPLLGLTDKVSMSKSKRVPIAGTRTKTGRPKTKVVKRVLPDCLPFGAVARFPYGMRYELGQTDFYLDKTPPFEASRYPVTDSYRLQIPTPAMVEL